MEARFRRSLIAPAIFLALFFGYPTGAFLLRAGFQFFSASDFSEIVHRFLLTSFIALTSVAFVFLLGLPLGYFLTIYSGRSRRVLEIVVTVPFLLPPFLIAIAFSQFHKYIHFSLGPPLLQIILAQSAINFGLCARVVAAALNAIPQSQIESAALDGLGWFHTLVQIQLPQIRSHISQILVVIALYCSTSYGLILLLGNGFVNTLETQIGLNALENLDLASAARYSLAQTLLTIMFYLIARRSFRTHQATLTSRVAINKLGPSGWMKRLLAFACLVLGLIDALMLASPALGSFRGISGWSFHGYSGLFSTGARNLLNISVASASINSLRNMFVATAIALPLAWLSAGARNRSLDSLTLIPLGISSVVLGLGYLIGFGSDFLPLRESWVVVPIAQSVILLPLLHQLLAPARRGLAKEILEAADLDGAGSVKRTFSIEAPILKPILWTAIGFGALVSLGEFGAASFLAYGDQSTLPLLMFRLAARPGAGNFSIAMAAATILIVLTFIVLTLTTLSNENE